MNEQLDVVVRGNLMWARDRSLPIPDLEEAQRYARRLRVGGYADWRLPTRDELEGLVDPIELAKAAKDRRPYPLVPPFDTSPLAAVRALVCSQFATVRPCLRPFCWGVLELQ